MEQSLATTKEMTQEVAAVMEKVVIGNDLSKLTPAERLTYYKNTCESMGLNPLSQPFAYINLKGKLTLYAQRNCADQLRKINGVSIDEIEKDTDGDFFIVTVKGHDKFGRSDMEIAAVNKRDMQGDYGNALMKCVTKAKRRLTLSLCGLGWMDETEVDTIKGARYVNVDETTGEIINAEPEASTEQPQQKPASQPKPQVQPAPQQEKPKFVEEDFLRQWQSIPGSAMTKTEAESEMNAKGVPYGTLSTFTLFQMLNMMSKKINTADEKAKVEYQRKISAINEIFNVRKAALTIAPVEADPFTEVTDADFIPLEA